MDLGERLLFLSSFVAHPRRVGAVLPTSRAAVRDMLDLAEVERAQLVVELGAGTGSHTAVLLERLAPQAELLAFEIDAALAAGLSRKLADRRLHVLVRSAEDVEEVLAGRRPEIVVSALPFTSLPAGTGRRILAATARVLAPGGTLLVLQYSPLLAGELSRLFGSVTRRVSLLNVPPAFLFACRDPRGAAPSGPAAAG